MKEKIVLVFKTDSDKIALASILFLLKDLLPLLLVLAINYIIHNYKINVFKNYMNKLEVIINGIKKKLTMVNLQS